MSNYRDPYRSASSRPAIHPAAPSQPRERVTSARPIPPGPDTSGAHVPPRRLTLSGLIRRTLVNVSEREQQRSHLLDILILVQGVLTLVTAPGYVGTPTQTLSIALALGATSIYLVAFATNRFFHRTTIAAYVLIIGGIIAVALQTLVLSFSADASGAGQVSLLFTSIILEAGLLFAPEVTLLIAFTTTTLTAFGILYALSHTATIQRQTAYLLIVYTVGLQLLAGLISWLVSQFIYESALEAQRAHELQFAQARLEALAGQVDEQQRQRERDISRIQLTIGRALGGDHAARVETIESDIAPLAEGLDLLLRRLEQATSFEHMGTRVDAAAFPILQNLTRLGEGGGASPNSAPIITNTPFDNVSVAVGQLQANIAQRLTRVNRVATDVIEMVTHSQEGFAATKDTLLEAQRILGALISYVESVVETTPMQVAALDQMRRMLIAVLPREITQAPEGTATYRPADDSEAGARTSLTGLGRDLGVGAPGYTNIYNVLQSGDSDSTSEGIVPLTRPLAIVDPAMIGQLSAASASDASEPDAGDGQGAATGETRHESAGLPAEIVEVWHLIAKATAEVAQIERALSHIYRELGVESKQLRAVDSNVAWFRQALDALQRNAEHLQQVAGSAIPTPSPEGGQASNSRPIAGNLGMQADPSRPRIPQPTRPLPPYPNAVIGPLDDSAGNSPSGAGATPTPGTLRASDLIDFTQASDNDYSKGQSGPLGRDWR